MASFAFVSNANAFVLRGATPVFIDIQDGTLNIDSAVIERAITTRTKAIAFGSAALVPVGRYFKSFEKQASRPRSTTCRCIPRRQGDGLGGRSDLQVTTDAADRIIRLPLWDGMTDAQLASVVIAVNEAVARI